MSDGLYAALAGAVAQGQALDVVANNLANVNTTGFKGDRLAFKEVLAQTERGNTVPLVRQVELEGTRTDFTQGSIRSTGNPLDVALTGPGFFTVLTPQGERYTRSGSFSLSPDGLLVTPDGFAVLGQNGPMRLVNNKPGKIEINEAGQVWHQGVLQDVLQVAQFTGPQALKREGSGLWSATPQAQRAETPTKLQVGAIEMSNVNAVSGMTQMIWISRAYETFHRAIEMFREIDRKTANELTL